MQVYYWIGSLADEPEFFDLKQHYSNTPVDTSAPVTSVEKILLKMVVDVDSNSTMNIIDQQAFFSMSVKETSTADEKGIVCPICNKRIDRALIEKHGDECATDNGFDVIISDRSDSEDEHLPSVVLPPSPGLPSNFAEDLQQQIVNNCTILPDGYKIRIKRGHSFTEFCEKMSIKRYQNQLGKQIFVEFYGEIGVDQEAIDEMKQMLFIEETNGFAPAPNLFSDLSKGNWKSAGILVASSICLGGPAPNFLANWVYEYLIDGCTGALKDLPPKIDGNNENKEFYQKLYRISTKEELRELFLTDEGLNVLSDIGLRSIPSAADMEYKETVLRSIYLKEKVSVVSPSLEQFSCGLDTYGLLQLVRNKNNLLQPVFCQSECLKWELETFEDMLEPNYSESGSSKKSLEIHSMKVFNDAIEKIYDEDLAVSFTDFMKFLTGARSVPPLGLSKKFKIEFIHECLFNCKCKIAVSTCALLVKLPIHYTTVDNMIDCIIDSIQLSRGLDDV